MGFLVFSIEIKFTQVLFITVDSNVKCMCQTTASLWPLLTKNVLCFRIWKICSRHVGFFSLKILCHYVNTLFMVYVCFIFNVSENLYVHTLWTIFFFCNIKQITGILVWPLSCTLLRRRPLANIWVSYLCIHAVIVSSYM